MDAALPKNQVKRHPERGYYDEATINAILDEAWYCHVATVREAMPIVIPTLHVRRDQGLYIHGAVAAGMFKDLATETPISVAVTLMDGIVLARSLYNHSANYRSVVIFGVAREVSEAQEKLAVLKALSDKIAPGRWDDARQPTASELKATRIFHLPLQHASAKIRTGPPIDDPDDLERATWSGILPLLTHRGAPVQTPEQNGSPPLPAYLAHWQDTPEPMTDVAQPDTE